MSVHEKMTAIADAIREKTGGKEPLTLDGMAASVPDVYDAGAKSEYDRFWDLYQDGGNRTGYMGAFAGTGWTKDTLHPKYDVICSGNGQNIFYASGFAGDLAQYLEDLGIQFDLSGATTVHSLFNNAHYITHIGVIDIAGCGAACSSLFAYCWALVTIDKIICNEGTVFNAWFAQDRSLENVTFEGTIAQNGLNLQWSTKLSHDSIVGIVNALSDSTAGLSVTLSETAVNNAFATEEWEALIATKSNWTINLV